MTEEKLRELYSQYYRLVMKAAYEVLHDFDYSQDKLTAKRNQINSFINRIKKGK